MAATSVSEEILSLPQMLAIPPKLLPLITEFNNYKYFVIEGGRGSAKTQSVARVLLYIAEQVKARIVCGREVQDTIEESVHAVLADLVRENNLAFRVRLNRIRHLISGSEFLFKGFREQGAVNIKGLEGADIIWPDEAQTMTENTLDVIIPTLRKRNVKFIFTMNRFMRNDAVIKQLVGRDDCLHIKINYFENPYCPLTLKDEAERMRLKDPKRYRHIWLGEPLAASGDYLMNFDKLYDAIGRQPFGDLFLKQRVMGIDFAAQGDDMCVATILDRKSGQHWQLTDQIAWGEADAMVSVGKIVQLLGEHKPDVAILDVGGMGHVVWNRLNEVLQGTKHVVQRFDGGGTDSMGVNTKLFANARAEGYYLLKEWFDSEFICINAAQEQVVKELETIKEKPRSSGVRAIQPKKDAKVIDGVDSPDHADSLMIAIFGAVKFLGKGATSNAEQNVVVRKSGSKRKR